MGPEVIANAAVNIAWAFVAVTAMFMIGTYSIIKLVVTKRSVFERREE